MTCHSGGTLEIYVEPHLACRRICGSIGTTPIAGALASLGTAAGWRVTRDRPDRRRRVLPGVSGSIGSARHPRARPGAFAVRRGGEPGIWDEEAVGCWR